MRIGRAAALAIAWSTLTTLPAHAADQGPSDAPPADDKVMKQAQPPPVNISYHAIQKAIADAKDPMDDIVPVRPSSFGTDRATAQQRIDRKFKEAEIPSCLTTDAFKFEPPTLGPIGLSGILALPFWMNAIATGKCRH